MSKAACGNVQRATYVGASSFDDSGSNHFDQFSSSDLSQLATFGSIHKVQRLLDGCRQVFHMDKNGRLADVGPR